MPQNKPLNFAQALRSKPGRPPEREANAQAPPEVETHQEEIQTPVQSEADEHASEMRTPTLPERGRPQSAEVDAHAKSVDANASTKIYSVDANASTLRKSGRPHKKGRGAHKIDRHRSDLIRQHFRISPEFDEKIRLFRAKNNLELQEFYQLAAAHLIDSVDAHKSNYVDALASHDDRDMMILFKTRPSIINIYLRYNSENRWKPADDFEGIRYNDKDIRLVEVGIIQTQFNARFKKINSFKYYVTEIDIALEAPLTDEVVELMLRQARRRWTEVTGREV